MMRLVTWHWGSQSAFLMSDAAFLLMIGQFICIGVLGVMAFVGRDYVGD